MAFVSGLPPDVVGKTKDPLGILSLRPPNAGGQTKDPLGTLSLLPGLPQELQAKLQATLQPQRSPKLIPQPKRKQPADLPVDYNKNWLLEQLTGSVKFESVIDSKKTTTERSPQPFRTFADDCDLNDAYQKRREKRRKEIEDARLEAIKKLPGLETKSDAERAKLMAVHHHTDNQRLSEIQKNADLELEYRKKEKEEEKKRERESRKIRNKERKERKEREQRESSAERERRLEEMEIAQAKREAEERERREEELQDREIEEWARREDTRLEQERLEQERLENERLDQERLDEHRRELLDNQQAEAQLEREQNEYVTLQQESPVHEPKRPSSRDESSVDEIEGQEVDEENIMEIERHNVLNDAYQEWRQQDDEQQAENRREQEDQDAYRRRQEQIQLQREFEDKLGALEEERCSRSLEEAYSPSGIDSDESMYPNKPLSSKAEDSKEPCSSPSEANKRPQVGENSSPQTRRKQSGSPRGRFRRKHSRHVRFAPMPAGISPRPRWEGRSKDGYVYAVESPVSAKQQDLDESQNRLKQRQEGKALPRILKRTTGEQMSSRKHSGPPQREITSKKDSEECLQRRKDFYAQIYSLMDQPLPPGMQQDEFQGDEDQYLQLAASDIRDYKRSAVLRREQESEQAKAQVCAADESSKYRRSLATLVRKRKREKALLLRKQEIDQALCLPEIDGEELDAQTAALVVDRGRTIFDTIQEAGGFVRKPITAGQTRSGTRFAQTGTMKFDWS